MHVGVVHSLSYSKGTRTDRTHKVCSFHVLITRMGDHSTLEPDVQEMVQDFQREYEYTILIGATHVSEHSSLNVHEEIRKHIQHTYHR
jgi:hypothetical protein